MTTRGRSLVRRARRLDTVDQVPLIAIAGNPEAVKLRFLFSDRQAMVGDDCFEALDGEETCAFHARLRRIARERGARTIELGHEANRAASEKFWNAQKAKAVILSASPAPEGSTLN